MGQLTHAERRFQMLHLSQQQHKFGKNNCLRIHASTAMATEGHASNVQPAEANVGLVNSVVRGESDVYRVLWRLWLALVTLSDLRSRGSPVRNLRRRVPALHDFLDGACRNAGVAIPCCRHACVSRSASWACPRLKIAQRASVPKPRLLVGSSPCKRLPRRSFHTDVCEENIACTIFVVGALAATIVGMMFVECFYMVGILAVCQALTLRLQQAVLWCLASNSDTSFASGASILVGLGGLEKAFPTQDTEGMEVIPVVSAIAAGLFDFFFCQTNCQPKCFMSLSAALVLGSNRVSQGPRFRLLRCTRGSFSLAVTSKSARAWAVDSGPCWCVPRRSFHAGVYNACTWRESSLRSCRRWSCCVWQPTRHGSGARHSK